MLNNVLLVLMIVGFSTSAYAQPTQSPQKAAYASPAEWPIVSSQVHWRAPGTGAIAGVSSHTHLDCAFPLYARLGSAPFTVPCKFVLFNTAGKITRLASSGGGWALDGGRTLPLVGDPNGVVTYTGTFTFTPSQSSAPAHGWYIYDMQTVTTYDNGDSMPNDLRLPVFSVIDTSQPETDNQIRHHSQARIRDATEPDALRWDFHFTEFSQILPVLGPVSPEFPWRVVVKGYNYAGTRGLAPGVLEIWLDPDLHNGNPGTLLASGPGGSMAYDFPGQVPVGDHRVMYMWRGATLDGSKELASNFVIPLKVGPGGVAQPSISTLPPPPPPPIASPLTLTASVTTIPVGQSYTVTGVFDGTSNDVHVVRLDGQSFTGASCVNGICTKTLTYTRAAGTYTHTLTAIHRNGTPWPTQTLTVTVGAVAPPPLPCHGRCH